ncbi:MAG: toxin-antitoxin system HicB family antitoxin [Chloroflexota bacterium]|nr:toxin-antitoxin system HicB family antitoxin [Chloroflexota bacterium]
MGRLTLRLPESLHQQLEGQARQEKVSLNQYLVYALTRHIAMAYMVIPVPEEAVRQQREAFAALLENLGQASSAEIKRVLDERDKVATEPGLDPEVASRLRQRIADASASG